MLIQYGSAPLHGTISMPPSKSAAHRLILGAALAALSGHGRSTVHPVDLSNDIKATLHAVQQMGFSLSYEEATRTVTVEPGWQNREAAPSIAANPVRPCVFSFRWPLPWGSRPPL